MSYLGNPKVRQLCPSGAVYKNIVGLDIAVHYAQAVRVTEGRRNLQQNLGPCVEGELSVSEQPRKAGSVNVVENKIIDSPLDAFIENIDNIRMVERFQRKKLSVESGERLQAGREFLLEDFYGDVALVCRVGSLVDGGHSTAPQHFLDAIAAHSVARLQVAHAFAGIFTFVGRVVLHRGPVLCRRLWSFRRVGSFVGRRI